MILAYAIGIGISAIENAYQEASFGKEFSIESMAAFDFINEAYTNASMGMCINKTSAGNGSCMQGYLEMYREVYMLKGIGFSLNNTIYVGNLSSEPLKRCFPYDGKVACLYIR
ncbi:MAG: hypothetical protein ACP5P2_02290 [Candidatus Micrarchaeia archaeon]